MTETRCPTPTKTAFGSEGAAKKSRPARRNKGQRMRAYRCECGQWHLTTMVRPD